MKKTALIILLFSVLAVVSCSKTPENKITKSASVEDFSEKPEGEGKVNIKYNKNGFSLFDEVKSIILTPDIKDIDSDNINYHWIIDDNNYVLFKTENGGATEIVNSGGLVILGIYAEIGYIDKETLFKYNITLQIEDKDSGEVLGSKTIVLEDKAGNYSIREVE